MLNTAKVIENIPTLNQRDALALADEIVDDMIAALKRDREIALRSFAQWELALADLRARIAERITNEISGHVSLSAVLLEIEAATNWQELLDSGERTPAHDGIHAQRRRLIMLRFVRPKANGTGADVNLDFGAAAAKLPNVFEPDEYKLRVQAARIIQNDQNILVALDLVELETGGRVDNSLIWVAGPNSDVGDLAARNQHIVAQLLTLAGLPTAGNVGTLLPQLAGLEFNARLALAIDGRTGRTHNELAEIFTAADAP